MPAEVVSCHSEMAVTTRRLSKNIYLAPINEALSTLDLDLDPQHRPPSSRKSSICAELKTVVDNTPPEEPPPVFRRLRRSSSVEVLPSSALIELAALIDTKSSDDDGQQPRFRTDKLNKFSQLLRNHNLGDLYLFLESLDSVECCELVNTRLSEEFFHGPYSYGTPLAYAIVNGDAERVFTLLKFGADHRAMPCVMNSSTENAASTLFNHLHLAFVLFCEPRVIHRLISFMELEDITAGVQDDKTQAIAMAVACMEYIAECTEQDLVVQLLVNFSDHVNIAGDFNRTPLHLATAAGNMTTVELLLKIGVEVNQGDKLGKTPLMYAVSSGSVAMVTKLVASGADVKQTDLHGRTALHFAVKEMRAEMVEILMSYGADVGTKTIGGLLPIDQMYLSSTREKRRSSLMEPADTRVQVAESLLKDSSSWYTFSEEQFLNIVFLLVKYGDESKTGDEDLINLLKMNENNLHLRNHHGQSLIHMAVQGGRGDLINWLLENGSDACDRDFHGWCPIHYAAVTGDIQHINILLRYGACINGTTQCQWSPVWILLRNGHREEAAHLIRHYGQLDLSVMKVNDIRQSAFSDIKLPLSLFNPEDQRENLREYVKNAKRKLTLKEFAEHMGFVEVVELL